MQAAASHPSRLHTTIRHGDGWTALALEGVVDEHSALDDVVDALQGPLVVVDAAGVARINSVGVRDWIHWMRRIQEAGHRVVLVDPSPALMDQVNLIRNFSGGAWIPSFMAPYYCDRCALEEDRRLDTRALLRTGARSAPSFPCGKPACAKTFDDVEDGYFAFLEDQEVPDDADRVAAIVEEARAALGGDERTTRPPPQVPMEPAAPSGHVEGPPPAPPGEGPPTRSRTADLAFLVVLVALGSLLGVLIYLMLTLE
ncbi:MAG: STAS domain-containing protein [Myxococcota bacterium]